MTNDQKLRRTVSIPLGRVLLSTIDEKMAKEKAMAAEPTGKGNLLVVDGFFGRMFRSDEGCVRDEIDEFCREYNEMCRQLDEDPAHQYVEVLSWNDLYRLHGIIPAVAQDVWGYTNSEDYRVHMQFEFTYVTEGKWAELFGEPFLLYEPREQCYPEPGYMEV